MPRVRAAPCLLNERVMILRHPETKKPIRTVHLDSDRELIATALAAGTGVLSVNPEAWPGWKRYRTETQRRDAGKWETLVHGRCAQTFGVLANPRLDLSYLRRQGGSLVRERMSPLPVTLLLSMKAPDGVELYDAVRSQFRVLTPVRVPLEIRTPA